MDKDMSKGESKHIGNVESNNANNKKRYIKWAIIAALFITCIAAALLLKSYFTHYKKNVPDKFTLYITPQTTYASLIDTLEQYLLEIRSFEKSFAKENPNGKMECGRYVFKSQTKNIEMVRAIRNGWQTPYRLTLSGNIRGAEKLSGILGRRLMRDSSEFSNYFNDPQIWTKYDLTKETFISLFIPNTYEVYWNCTPEEFTNRMAKEHSRFWTEERLKKAQELGLSKEEVSTLASIVCEESNYGPELPTIAGVYINRLKRGMRLEADPTVKYALNDPSIKRILFKHLKVDSPYNTYKHPGLPPGPITIPSSRGIDAVLNYEKHKYLYFCANANLDGTHKFASTLSEHNRNAREYQRAISRK